MEIISNADQKEEKRVVKRGNKTRLKVLFVCFLRYSYSTSVLDRSHNHANKAAEHFIL